MFRSPNNLSIKKGAIGLNLVKGEFTHISKDCIIGDNVFIGSNCSISDGSIIGDNVQISNNVVIQNGSMIGDNTIIQSGAVIGSDGFGTVKDNDCHLNFPHIGKVIIGKDVWIGSNTTIDRGSIGNPDCS